MEVLFVSALLRLSDDKVCVDNNTAFTVTRPILLCWQTRPGGRIGNVVVRQQYCRSEGKRTSNMRVATSASFDVTPNLLTNSFNPHAHLPIRTRRGKKEIVINLPFSALHQVHPPSRACRGKSSAMIIVTHHERDAERVVCQDTYGEISEYECV